MKKIKGCMLALVTVLSVQVFAQPSPVEVAKVAVKDLAPVVWAPGTVISRQDSRIAAEVEGMLLHVVDVGDRVKKGQALAQLNDRILQLNLRNNESDILRLQARLAFTENQLQRSQRLAEASSTAQYRVDELAMERDVLTQEIEVAKVQRDKTRYNIERAQFLAPFDGVVVERMHQPGEHIAAGEALLRLVNLDSMEIRAKAPITVSRFVEATHEVDIRTADMTTMGSVRAIVPVGDQSSRMLEVRLDIDAREPWVVGEAVQIALHHGVKKPSLAVPRDALVLRNESVYIYRINDENKAERIQVETGEGNGSEIAILGGLSEGDLIVTRGAERLKDGGEVTILKSVASR